MLCNFAEPHLVLSGISVDLQLPANRRGLIYLDYQYGIQSMNKKRLEKNTQLPNFRHVKIVFARPDKNSSYRTILFQWNLLDR